MCFKDEVCKLSNFHQQIMSYCMAVCTFGTQRVTPRLIEMAYKTEQNSKNTNHLSKTNLQPKCNVIFYRFPKILDTVLFWSHF